MHGGHACNIKIPKPCCRCSQRKKNECDLHLKFTRCNVKHFKSQGGESIRYLQSILTLSNVNTHTLVTHLCSYDLLALVKCSEATEQCEGCSPIQQGHLQERDPRAELPQISNDSISYTDGTKWHPEISAHSLSMHYICSLYFRYWVVMVMHTYACKDRVKHLTPTTPMQYAFFCTFNAIPPTHRCHDSSKINTVWFHCQVANKIW